ncbi:MULTISPECIES: histidine--tRNA ligase [Desulfococcus]|jgi:histidyl-tRNA synthetase|uniref:Histidine--tRNA ligase n=1 Tax=Desulfococcus multivorans DSM 2059 TaxID=1121405 RepID=S7TPM1_DESML|nr:histidine--tRNA ligase [Desulfococcus multivorans]AOY57791.1 HisS: histidyl-tRNA synthetase [Desulfococcus multivorans]AQV00176.1 histidine--tRNA ligase [Desulfococcus multivorans]EPR38876.1 Histidyl-tRNA synthetase [Desulfococcus multivorans DSM 2059]SJZ68256.1 histidyl-tRNA synthetase [Desulfococcus multivorans DSM 2059]
MIQLIRGFKDILPGEVEIWQEIERVARTLFEDFGFKEIRIPIMESTELFARSIGEHTDIVEKEMYTFPDRKGDLITLRPEATASVVRAYIQHKMYAADPVRKFYTIGPMFRRERPQKGRYRQFYQINAEVIGVDAPYIDAQLIFLLTTLLDRLKVTDVAVHINSLGCPECRPAFREALTVLLDGKKENLCADCLRRSSTNPLRVLDCKVPACREAMADAPSLLDYLCDGCAKHFASVQGSLNELGVPFVIDKQLVRGLDYYTRTTFEIQTGALGAQSAVAGGGRYDGLVKMLDGPDTPAIGFAVGFDRLVEIVGLRQADFEKTPQLFIAALGETCAEKAFDWVCRLGLAGVHTEMDMAGRSLKSQMKQADRSGAAFVLIIGESELASGTAILRNMRTKAQSPVPIDANTVKAIIAHIRPLET